MNSLKNLIKEKTYQLSSTEIPHELEIEFFEEFLKQYSVHNFNSYQKISNASYLISVLVSNNINIDFVELVQYIKIIEDFINDMDFDIALFDSYLNNLFELNELGLLEKIINKEKLIGLDRKSKILYNDYLKNSKKLFTLDNGESEEYCYKIHQTFNKIFIALPDPKKFHGFIDLNIIVENLKPVLEQAITEGFEEAVHDNMFDDFDKHQFQSRNFNKFLEKEKGKIINGFLKDFIESEDFNLIAEYEMIRKYYEQILKEAKDVVKTTNKKIKALEEFEYKLKFINSERLLKIDDSIEEFLFDSEIKYYYLMLALSHNYEIYKKEEQKNIEFNNNSLTKLEILFSKYGFNFNEFNEEEQKSIININNTFEVESMLNSIKYSELSFISDYAGEFAKVITFSKPEIIKFIDVLFKNKIIDKNFIFKNINILYDTIEFENLHNNINYLNSIGINLSNLVKNNSDILLLNSDELIANTSILSVYNLKLDKDCIYNFDILKDDRMLDLLDNYIELGLKDIILDNPKYLNTDGFNIIKRIMISNLIGLNPLNKSNKLIGIVTTGNNFYVESSKYDNYIIDYKYDYQNPKCVDILNSSKRNVISQSTKNRLIVKKLDELYMKDELTYVINGVIISRNRVIRNLEVLFEHLFNSDIDVKDLIYQAILYKMINNIEPNVLEQIYNSVCSIELENAKTYILK